MVDFVSIFCSVRKLFDGILRARRERSGYLECVDG